MLWVTLETGATLTRCARRHDLQPVQIFQVDQTDGRHYLHVCRGGTEYYWVPGLRNRCEWYLFSWSRLWKEPLEKAGAL